MLTKFARALCFAALASSVAFAGCGKCGSAATEVGAGAPIEATSATPAKKSVRRATLKARDGSAPFSPSTNGFKFANYGDDTAVKNLTPTELRRMFGDAVCAELAESGCTLTPPAQAWMSETNKAMAGGHCEGFAALSLLMDLGKISPNDFGAPTTFALELDGNAKLQREIAYWMSTQFVPPMSGAEIKNLTPNQIVDRLVEALSKSGGETYTLGLYQPDGSRGHATTPYAVVDNGNATVSILHYDNNFPGEAREIVVDRKANRWTYDTAADPKDPPEKYTGDAETFSLTLGPTSVRLGKLDCPFCGTVTAGSAGVGEGVDVGEGDDGVEGVAAKGSARGVREIFLDGAADLLITDAIGKRLGRVDGRMVDEIPGASYVQPKSGHAEDEEPIYLVPVGRPLKVVIDGSKLKRDSATELSLIGPGYTLGVEGLMLHVGQRDTVEFSKGWGDVRYTTKQSESPTLTLGIDGDLADYSIAVRASGEGGGETLELSIDVKKGTFTFNVADAKGKVAYAVELHRYDAKGEQVFTHKGLALDDEDVAEFSYATWKGNGSPLKLSVEDEKSGKSESERSLGDDE